LSLRVLTRLSFDAYWFRQALDVFTSERPSLNRLTRACANITYPLSDFSRLQGLDQAPSPGWEPGHSLGLNPFQRHHHIAATREAPASNALRSQVFATSQQILCANNGLSVYSTRLTLVGSGPSELYLRTIKYCFQPHGSCVVTCLAWFPSFFRSHSRLLHHGGLPLPAMIIGKWPTDSR